MAPNESMSAGERALGRLLCESHLASPDALPDIVGRAAAEFGARDAELRIIDHEQTVLVSLAGHDDPVPVEGTIAGRAYRQLEVQETLVDGGCRLWAPILDGLERLGILAVTFDTVDELVLWRVRRLATLTAELLLAMKLYGDPLRRAARRREMSLAAEMQWELMPPLTAGTPDVALAAMLEPAYDVGGDLIDYALTGRTAHFAIIDAMGHGVQASLLAALALGTYRNRRRAGDELEALPAAIDRTVAEQFGLRMFLTAVLAALDTEKGRLRWVNCGHHAPLLLRGGRVVKELAGAHARPLGMTLNEGFPVREELLEPGDRLLLYTDGVIEARTPSGEQFGLERLIDFLVRAQASAEPIQETMRRLSHAVLAHQQGELRDDATLLLVEWRTGAAQLVADRFMDGL